MTNFLYIIIGWVLGISTFIIGYLLGKGSITRDEVQRVREEIKHKIYPHFRQPSGVVQRPDAKRVHDLSHPEILEEKEEMQKALDEGIEPLTI